MTTTTTEGLHQMSGAFEDVRKKLGLPPGGEREKLTGEAWKTHAELEEQHPRLAEAAQEEEARGKIAYINRMGTDVGYVPTRQFPCPGMLVIDPDELRGTSPTLVAECDECGYRTGFQRSAYDPNFALARNLAKSGLPEHFLGKQMEPVPGQVDARNLVRQWVQQWKDHDDPALRVPAPALHGQPGRGKSHLICSAAETLLKLYGTDVQYWSLAALLSKVREGFNDAADPEVKRAAAAAWDRAKAVELLVLDDIGAERATEWAAEQFQLLVDHRYNAALPILLASNIPPGEWAAAFGARTASRLEGMSYIFELRGDDLRVNPPVAAAS